jgi:putative flippase GtrA
MNPSLASPAAPASWRVFARHQAASIVTTVVDFGTMTALVELGRDTPALATLVGALIGACLNFYLNRRFTFQTSGRSRRRSEALRYASVSGASALLNAAGEYAGTVWLGAPYLFVRLVVAVAVSVGWNFPMHRFFVFAPEKAH